MTKWIIFLASMLYLNIFRLMIGVLCHFQRCNRNIMALVMTLWVFGATVQNVQRDERWVVNEEDLTNGDRLSGERVPSLGMSEHRQEHTTQQIWQAIMKIIQYCATGHIFVWTIGSTFIYNICLLACQFCCVSVFMPVFRLVVPW